MERWFVKRGDCLIATLFFCEMPGFVLGGGTTAALGCSSGGVHNGRHVVWRWKQDEAS